MLERINDVEEIEEGETIGTERLELIAAGCAAALFVLFLALVAALMGVVLSIRMSRPIKQITQAVDDFTHQRLSQTILIN